LCLFKSETVFKETLKKLHPQAILTTDPTAPSDIAVKTLASQYETYLKVKGECELTDLERNLGLRMDLVLDHHKELKRILRQLGFKVFRTRGSDRTNILYRIKNK
jgi:hypothetical protein